MRAYVLINVRPGKVRDVVSSVASLQGVMHADACWGLPDVFAYVETPDENSLHALVMEKIQRLEGVDRTETHIAVG
ncbi:MAG TPA: Lrp/AsnC ligand binding domain-containing protein [Terriglobia bacterium]|nr:Lrp/AsnC ligand binding domain-containing protein [Terriglobia bacterium]